MSVCRAETARKKEDVEAEKVKQSERLAKLNELKKVEIAEEIRVVKEFKVVEQVWRASGCCWIDLCRIKTSSVS